MSYARLIVETGFTPKVLDEMDLEVIADMILYKQIKEIALNGGEWNGR